MISMRRVIPVLFLSGCIWVPFVWIAAIGRLGDDSWVQWLVRLAAIGFYWVWFGWGWYIGAHRFPLVSPRTFWASSYATHLLWLALLINMVQAKGAWLPPPTFCTFWILSNVIIAAIGMLTSQPALQRPEHDSNMRPMI